jgi:ABC-type polysaccharide/polyol phosphate export permease
MDVRTSATTHAVEMFPSPAVPRGPSVWVGRLHADAELFTRYWPVIHNLVTQELKVRYQRSMLGFFWTMLNPLLMLATLSLVFKNLPLGAMKSNYTVFLFSGMVPWALLNNTLSESAGCIIANEGLIRKIYIPKLVFPISRVLINTITLVLTLGALFLLLVLIGARPAFSFLMLPLAIALFGMFSLGLGLIVATANTFFRDCGHLVAVFLQAWYFATPILYQESAFPVSSQWFLRLNPAYHFIELFHAIIEGGKFPPPSAWLMASAIASVSLTIGYTTFKSNEDKMVFRL